MHIATFRSHFSQFVFFILLILLLQQQICMLQESALQTARCLLGCPVTLFSLPIRYRYLSLEYQPIHQSDISEIQTIHTLMTYFVECRVRKATSSDITQTENNRQFGICCIATCCWSVNHSHVFLYTVEVLQQNGLLFITVFIMDILDKV